MKKRTLTAVAACTLAAALASTAAQASPADRAAQQLGGSPLRFTFIQYDSPGNDLPPTNAKLNAEFVTIYNPTTIARTMTGFRVHDAGTLHTYRFGTFRLGPQKSVRLHTGSGRNTATNRYWGQGNYVWNNTGDTASLVAATGAVVDTCKWGDGPGSIHC